MKNVFKMIIGFLSPCATGDENIKVKKTARRAYIVRKRTTDRGWRDAASIYAYADICYVKEGALLHPFKSLREAVKGAVHIVAR